MNNENTSISTLCLVCGYDLKVNISTARAHDVICPSCGMQYGYTDTAGGSLEKREKLYKLWREAWILNQQRPLSKEKKIEVISSAMAS
jgi:hypothetical protein